MKINSFVFHESLPNNEDVLPVATDGWVAVADGMGGSGCTDHRVDTEKRKDLETVLRVVLPEYFDEKNASANDLMKPYVEGDGKEPSYLAKIFAPCIENEENTSARWGSRTVMTRFLYGVMMRAAEGKKELTDKDAAEMGKFIDKGLVRVKEGMGLEVEDRGKSSMPSTFAAVHFSEREDGKYDVEAVWAGDSRCYLLDGNGLRRISVDDEDESKLLVNFFCADYPVNLRVRRYVADAPFAVLCGSDGFFDVYDRKELTVEARFLGDVFEVGSFDALKEKLEERYACNSNDDTSVAFTAVGYESYEEFKNSIAAHKNETMALYEKHVKLSDIVNLVDKPEGRVTVSVCDRFEMKFRDVAKAIVKNYYEDGKDVLLSEKWREAISTAEKEYLADEESRRKAKADKLGDAVYAYIEEKGFFESFLKNAKFEGAAYKAVKEYREACERYESEKGRIVALNGRKEDLAKEKSAVYSELVAEQRRLADAYVLVVGKSEKGDENEQTLVRERIKLSFRMNTVAKIENILAGDGELFKIKSGGEYENIFYRAAKCAKYSAECESELSKAEAVCARRENERNEALKRLRAFIPGFVKISEKIFTQELIAAVGLDKAEEKISEDELREAVTAVIVERYGADREFMDSTLADFKANPEAETCIDAIFPSSRLADFKNYYKYRSLSDSEEFVNYRKQMEEYGIKESALIASDAEEE